MESKTDQRLLPKKVTSWITTKVLKWSPKLPNVCCRKTLLTESQHTDLNGAQHWPHMLPRKTVSWMKSREEAIPQFIEGNTKSKIYFSILRKKMLRSFSTVDILPFSLPQQRGIFNTFAHYNYYSWSD